MDLHRPTSPPTTLTAGLPRAALLLALLAAPAAAQTGGGLPPHESLNPLAVARSPLLFLPYQEVPAGRWRSAVSLEYGNWIDYQLPIGREYLLDAEVYRLQLTATRDVARGVFVQGTVGVSGAWRGFADGFFTWYHDLIRFTQPERLARPKNTFGYDLALPDGTVLSPRPAGPALEDVRLTAGWRATPHLQVALTATLPTNTAPEGYRRGVPAAGAVATWRQTVLRRVTYELSAGGGLQPRYGVLSDYQRTAFASAATGIRIRLWGRQAIYGYLWYHSPRYLGTGIQSVDAREFTGDFGWIGRSKGGREWRVGLGEDFAPNDLAGDLVLKASWTF